jgi:adenylate cyclase
MLVGNLGCKNRIEYTAIGDAVNLTSRVEGMNRYFGTSVLFTEATRREMGGEPRALPVATVRVKGRREEVELFTIFEPPLPPDVASLWQRSLELFKNAEFAEAAKAFKEISEQEARLRTASELYLSQCAHLSASPPDRRWAGELNFENK